MPIKTIQSFSLEETQENIPQFLLETMWCKGVAESQIIQIHGNYR